MGNQALCCGSKPNKRKKTKELSTRPSEPTPRRSPETPKDFSAAAKSFPPREITTETPCPPEVPWDTGAILAAVDAAFSELAELTVTSESMKQHVNKPDMRIYGTETRRGFLMKSCWEVPYPPETVLKFENNNEFRLMWDPNVAELREVGHVTGEVGINYERYKKMMIVSQRDLLTAGRASKFKNGILDVSVSVEVKTEPEIRGMVRAQLFVGGYDIQPTETGSSVTLYSEMDFGGSVPKSMLVHMSALTLPGFIKAFREGLDKYAPSL